MDAKKLKLIVRGDKKPTFGTDPNEPWSVRAGITESERGELHAYLKSRGINPDFVSKDTKISHAKSSEFHKWRRDHQFDDPINFVSTTVADKMKMQRAQTEEVEQMNELAPETLASYVLKTTSKDPKRAEPRKKAMSKLAKIMAKRSFSEEKKPTALEKFRAAAAEREKKHAEIEKKQSKDGSGMTAAIDRLAKHLNKEESEQVNEMDTYPHPDSKEGKALMKAFKSSAKKDPTDLNAPGKSPTVKQTTSALLPMLNKSFKKAMNKEEVELTEVSKSEVDHHFHQWTNSEHAPYNSDAGDDNKVHQSALRYLRSTDVPKENHEKLAMHIAHKFHGSGIDEEAEQIDEKNVPTSPEKWARAKAAAKSKFAVYPSAYANGWASKKYKAMGGGWKSVNEEVDITEKNDSHTHAAHYEDPKTGEWTGMNLLIAKDDDDAIRQAHEKCKEGCRLTKVERHITVKEEAKQIDELKMSTVKSYHKKRLTDFSYSNKKPGETSTKPRNARIKKVSAGIDRSIDRQTGYKPTSESAGASKTKETQFHKKLDTLVHDTFGKRKDELKMKEDVYQDSQAATQTAFDMGTQADDRVPTYSKRKEMSKSARMIKSLYKKHKMVKEDLYDHEKEDKSVAAYGKKPKVDKQEVYGDDDTQAAMILKGGTTLTGQTRDTLEIDPVMRKPVKPDNQISNRKTDK